MLKFTFKQKVTFRSDFEVQQYDQWSAALLNLTKKFGAANWADFRNKMAYDWAKRAYGLVQSQIDKQQFLVEPDGLKESTKKRKGHALILVDQLHQLSKDLKIALGGTGSVSLRYQGATPARSGSNRDRHGRFKARNAAELTVEQLAAVHEFGTRDGHVPARPFFLPALQRATEELMASVGDRAYETLFGVTTELRNLRIARDAAGGY